MLNMTLETLALKEGIPDDTYDVLRDPAVAKKHKELL
jgi:hypothetical protein